MKNKRLIEHLQKIAKVDNSWMKEVDYYEANKERLDLEFKQKLNNLHTKRLNLN